MRKALGMIKTLIARGAMPRTSAPPACPSRRCPAFPAPPSRTPTMSVRILQVDSFTNRAFAGNPAAVCLLEAPAAESWMQHVAAEMNLSETAFVHPLEAGPVFRLRWFTPRVEVDLCGHATLAAAHVLWEEGLLRPEAPALFETRSGRLSAMRKDDWIELDFPAEAVTRADHRRPWSGNGSPRP